MNISRSNGKIKNEMPKKSNILTYFKQCYRSRTESDDQELEDKAIEPELKKRKMEPSAVLERATRTLELNLGNAMKDKLNRLA